MNTAEVDARVIEVIRGGTKRFGQIHQTLGGDFRRLDRKMQGMRKAGLLKYEPKTGWSVPEVSNV